MWIDGDGAYQNTYLFNNAMIRQLYAIKLRNFVADFLYRHNVTFDNVTTEVEILDTSKCAVSRFLQIRLY